MRRSKQALIALAVAGCAGAACLVLVFILASRDSSDVGAGATGPGVQQPDRGEKHLTASAPPHPASPPADPPTSGPHHVKPVTRDRVALSDDELLSALELGNVVIAYDTAQPSADLIALQRDAGPFSAALAAAGQAVILDHRPGAGGTIALAWRRALRSSDAGQLRDFTDAWLGQGAGGSG